jgi:hypothetical protein
MEPRLLTILQLQIWTQCRFALIAHDELQVRIANVTAALAEIRAELLSLRALPFDEQRVRQFELGLDWAVRSWHPVQAFLSATANISKALWGQGGSLTAERRALRESLGVDDLSPLRHTSMRNNFDHFDERLDEWWRESAQHLYVDLNFGAFANAYTEQRDVFRNYDPATGELTFWGERYDLPAVAAEIRRIMPLALEKPAPASV